jgi:hypothetical protein
MGIQWPLPVSSILISIMKISLLSSLTFIPFILKLPLYRFLIPLEVLSLLGSRPTGLPEIDWRYMAQLGNKCPIHAAVFLAPCFDIARALEGFKRGTVTKGGSIYSASAVKKMCISAAEKFAAAGFPIDELPPPKGPHVSDLYEVLMPYLTGTGYGEFSNSLIRDLEEGIPKITVPSLFIGSYLDSITGTHDGIHEAVKGNPNFIRIMLHTKSHLGYYSGLIKPKRWAQKPIFEFIHVRCPSGGWLLMCRPWLMSPFRRIRKDCSGINTLMVCP